MKELWDFFENMDEYVYAADIDTYELVYLNKKMREAYGIDSLEKAEGRKCHEILQNCSEPCAVCNGGDLEAGFFREWENYNLILDKHLMLKDTLVEEEGRRYRVEIALDATAQGIQGSMLRSYQDMEALVNEGIRTSMETATPDQAIEAALEYFGKALCGERAYIFEKNIEGGDDNTYEWVANGITPQKDTLQNLPPEVCENWYRSFGANKNILIENLEEIREEDPLQYENLKRQDIHSLVAAPLYDGKKVIGFYGIDNPPERSLHYAAQMLQIIGYFIIFMLRRRNLVNQLYGMSHFDQLTGLGNRHGMNEYMESIPENEDMGIVYCDITGLKRMNDTKGHKEGDRLIIHACECLKDIFGEYELFRVGGDELLAVCGRISRETLEAKANALKEELRKHSVVMALGWAWKDKNKKGDIERLIAQAEQMMYDDKRAYYQARGIDRRG